jgi:hypothetical protein
MSTIDIGNLPGKRFGDNAGLSHVQGREMTMQLVFEPLSLIRGGGNGGNVTITATTSISTGTTNSKSRGGEILNCTRFYIG